MNYAVVTDCKYRSAIPVARALSRAGYTVIAVQTKGEMSYTPPVFFSKHVKESIIIDCSAKEECYADKLISALEKYARPVLFCTGADTLRTVANNRERFEKYADFTISDLETIDMLNDKELVAKRAEELGLMTPKSYSGVPDEFPVVIKPHCGEKSGLKAEERYAVATDVDSYNRIMDRMRRYDDSPIVQKKITGDGMGACILIDKKGALVNAICHRRVREYPVTGGPSACCDSFYDEKMIEQAYRLLRSFSFVGMAMVEFKGEYILEVNPRLWGSYPLTECSDSHFTESYAKISRGENFTPSRYKNVRMHFLLNDALSIIGYLRAGKVKTALRGCVDMITAKEALFDIKDAKPFFKYIISNLRGK